MSAVASVWAGASIGPSNPWCSAGSALTTSFSTKSFIRARSSRTSSVSP